MRPNVMTMPLLAACLAVAGCQAPKDNQQNTGMARRQVPWTVVYADGSANVFTFSSQTAEGGATVSYEPVTPEASSTGLYSGGTSKLSSLDGAGERRLWMLLEELEHTEAEHSAERDKGTGAFTLTMAGPPRRFIVRRGPLLDAFESFVAPYRGVPAAQPP